MRRSLYAAAFMVVGALSPAADAAQPCAVVPMPCTFEGEAFAITIVDAETHRPVSDVHALAEWRMYGPGDRPNGPLMVQDATSTSDGVVTFPGWGPLPGPRPGLVVGDDPVITLFKSGYRPFVVNNMNLPPGRERERVRRFLPTDRTLGLQPFRGTPDEWVQELKKIYRGMAFPRADDQSAQFRSQYLNRIRRVWAERDHVPEIYLRRPEFFWFVADYMNELERASR